jgi:hypothetical protein
MTLRQERDMAERSIVDLERQLDAANTNYKVARQQLEAKVAERDNLIATIQRLRMYIGKHQWCSPESLSAKTRNELLVATDPMTIFFQGLHVTQQGLGGWGGGCAEWKVVVGDYVCCPSCHVDEADGYSSMLWRFHRGLEYEVCCTAPKEPIPPDAYDDD